MAASTTTSADRHAWSALALHALIAASPLLLATAADAQQAQQPEPTRSPTISVDLTQVSADIARRIGVDEANMPMSLQLPPDQAAQVCAIADRNSCTATRSSSALDQLVGTRMKADETPPTNAMGAGAAPTAPGQVPKR